MKLKDLAKIPMAFVPLVAAVANGAELCTYPVLNQASQYFLKDITGLTNIEADKTIASIKVPSIICVDNRSGGQSEESMHIIVKSGDSLESIAARYGTSVKRLMDLNQMRNPDNLWVGSRIKVSGKVLKESKSPFYTPYSSDMNPWVAKILDSCRTRWGAPIKHANDVFENRLHNPDGVLYFLDASGNRITFNAGVLETSDGHVWLARNYFQVSSDSQSIIAPCGTFKGRSWLELDKGTEGRIYSKIVDYTVNKEKRKLLVGATKSIYIGVPRSNRSGQQGSF
jgi:LysM repeat protein